MNIDIDRTYASVTLKIYCRVRQISIICLFTGFMQFEVVGELD